MKTPQYPAPNYKEGTYARRCQTCEAFSRLERNGRGHCRTHNFPARSDMSCSDWAINIHYKVPGK